jgi:hypothetical protein
MFGSKQFSRWDHTMRHDVSAVVEWLPVMTSSKRDRHILFLNLRTHEICLFPKPINKSTYWDNFGSMLFFLNMSTKNRQLKL